MKIVPLFPRVQQRTVQPDRSPWEKTEPPEPRDGITVNLKAKTKQTSNLSRDEAFILLGRTMSQLGGADGGHQLDGLHQVRGDRAVGLLVRD